MRYKAMLMIALIALVSLSVFPVMAVELTGMPDSWYDMEGSYGWHIGNISVFVIPPVSNDDIDYSAYYPSRFGSESIVEVYNGKTIEYQITANNPDAEECYTLEGSGNITMSGVLIPRAFINSVIKGTLMDGAYEV